MSDTKPDTKVTIKSSGDDHHIFLSKQIDEPHYYEELIWLLTSSKPHHSFTFHINCGGGYIHSGIQILNAMEECKGKITTILEGNSHSMASYIFLAGDDRIVRDCTFMCCHNYGRGFSREKGGALLSQLEADKKNFNELIMKYYSDFLTEDEINNIHHDKDLWLISEEIRERLND